MISSAPGNTVTLSGVFDVRSKHFNLNILDVEADLFFAVKNGSVEADVNIMARLVEASVMIGELAATARVAAGVEGNNILLPFHA